MTTVELISSHCDPQPLQFPVVDARELELQSLLPPDSEFTLNLGAHTLRVQLRYQEKVKPLPLILDVSINQHPLVLELDNALVAALLSNISSDHPLGALPFEQLPTAIQLALLQSAMSPLISYLSEDSGLQIRLENIRSGNDTMLSGNRLVCECNFRNENGWVAITLTDKVISLLQPHLSPESITDATPKVSVDELPLQASISLGRTVLTGNQINTLETYDIVLLEQPSTTRLDSSLENSPLQVKISVEGKLLFSGLLQKTLIEITHIDLDQTMENSTESQFDSTTDSSTENVAQEPKAYLDALPLEVTFEVARQNTTVKQIKSLTPGQTFSLNKPLQSIVTLIVNGQTIAEAELVKINDQLGARITRRLLPNNQDGNVNNDYST